MSVENSTDRGPRWGRNLLIVGIILTLIFGTVAVTAGDSGPPDRIGVQHSIFSGDHFENLSETAKGRLQPAFENGTDPGTINESEYNATFPTFPPLSEFAEDASYIIEYNDHFYQFGLNLTSSPKYSIEVSNETETVRIEYAELDREMQNIIERAATSDGPINVSQLPPIYQAPGKSFRPLGSVNVYYLSWNGTYFTVTTYEPIEFIETPSIGEVLGSIGAVVGILLALIGGGILLWK